MRVTLAINIPFAHSKIRMKKLCQFLVIFLLLLHLNSVAGHEVKNTALSFRGESMNYILLEKDTSMLRESFSVCSWVRIGRLSARQVWISYAVNQRVNQPGEVDFAISDTTVSLLFGDGPSLNFLPDRNVGEWHHICSTWSFTSKVFHIYYDGAIIGSLTTPDERKLRVPGRFILGQLYVTSYGYDNMNFGGTLYDTNIFSVQLTNSQVKNLFDQGLCGNKAQIFIGDIFVGWNEILEKDRAGTVSEVKLECDDEQVKEGAATASNCSTWDFLRHKRFFNKNITVQLLHDMTDKLELLSEFRNHTIDNALINHLKEHHPSQPPKNDTNGETEDEAEEATDWEFLTEDPFFNKIVTEELLLAYTDSLDLLAEFIGHHCDEALIQHLKKHHSHCKFEKP